LRSFVDVSMRMRLVLSLSLPLSPCLSICLSSLCLCVCLCLCLNLSVAVCLSVGRSLDTHLDVVEHYGKHFGGCVEIETEAPFLSCIRQHTSAYVSICQHMSASEAPLLSCKACSVAYVLSQVQTNYVNIRQHTSAYVSIRQHPPASVSIPARHAALRWYSARCNPSISSSDSLPRRRCSYS
jgi:hypothetical protein